MSDLIALDSAKRPAEMFAERGYLIDPWPEEWRRLDGFGTDNPTVGSVFTAGLKIVAETPSGLKITPAAYVIFEIDGKQMDLPADSVRDLVQRLESMCAAADEINKGRGLVGHG